MHLEPVLKCIREVGDEAVCECPNLAPHSQARVQGANAFRTRAEMHS